MEKQKQLSGRIFVIGPKFVGRRKKNCDEMESFFSTNHLQALYSSRPTHGQIHRQSHGQLIESPWTKTPHLKAAR